MAPQILTDWSQIERVARGRICFLARGLDGGGAQRDAILLANALARRGYPSAIVTLEGRGHLVELVEDGVPILDLGRGGKLRLAFALGPLRRLLARGKPGALVSSEAGANVLTVLASRLVRPQARPRIILREVASPVQARTGDPYWQNRLAYRLAGAVYPLADLVLTFTQGARADLIGAFGMPAAKVVSLGTNAVLTAEMRDWIGRHERTPEPGLIVSVGRLSGEKGYGNLLEAFALVRQRRTARLVIVGEGNERGVLEAQTARLRLGGDVVLAGQQQNPLAFMARAAVYVSSSWHEGLGNALVEAMAVGVPVVATDAPHGPREILEDGRLGPLVPVGDPRALAAAIVTLLDAPTDGAILQARAAEFSVEAAAERFIAVLSGIVGPADASAAPATHEFSDHPAEGRASSF